MTRCSVVIAVGATYVGCAGVAGLSQPTGLDPASSSGGGGAPVDSAGGGGEGEGGQRPVPPPCENGVLDDGEVAVDCGGECRPCPKGTICTRGTDCLTGRCGPSPAEPDTNVCVAWAAQVTGGARSEVTGMEFTPDGGLVVVGHFQGEVSLFDAPTAVTSLEGRDGFVARLDRGGLQQWSVAIRGTSVDEVNGVDVADDGAIAIVGRFLGTAPSIGGSPICDPSQGPGDSFVAKFAPPTAATAPPALDWARCLSGTDSESLGEVRFAPDGSLWVGGEFSSEEVTNEAGETVVENPASDPVRNIMLLRLSADDGSILSRFAYGSAPGDGFLTAIEVDSDGVVIGGSVTGATTLLDGTMSSGVDNTRDFFLQRWDSGGEGTWFARYPSAGFGDLQDLLVRPDGRVFAAGSYAETVTVAGETSPRTGGMINEAGMVVGYEPNGAEAWVQFLAPTPADDSGSRGEAVVGAIGRDPIDGALVIALNHGGTLALPEPLDDVLVRGPDAEALLLLKLDPDTGRGVDSISPRVTKTARVSSMRIDPATGAILVAGFLGGNLEYEGVSVADTSDSEEDGFVLSIGGFPP